MKKVKAQRKDWLKVTAAADHVKMIVTGTIGVSIYEPGTSSQEFCTALAQIDDAMPVHVLINSEGGSVHAAVEIYNALKARGNCTAYITGVALSAASILALGCDRVISPIGSCWMIHSPLVGTFGNEEEHQRSINLLRSFGDSMADIYAAETGQDKDEILSLMADETWFTGPEAVEFGLADATSDSDTDEEESEEDEDSAVDMTRAQAVLAMYRPPQKIRELLQAAAPASPENKVTVTPTADGGVTLAFQKTKTISSQLAGVTGTAAGNTNKNTKNMSKPNTQAAADTSATDNNNNPDLRRFIEERKARITAEVQRRAEGRIKNDDLQWWIDLAVNAESMADENKVYAQIDKLPKVESAGHEPLAPVAATKTAGDDDTDETGPVARARMILGEPTARKDVDKHGHVIEIGSYAPTAKRVPFAMEIRKMKSARERVEAMKRDWAGMLNYAMELDTKAARGGNLPVAANSYSQTLITDNLVDSAITILTNTWPALSCFTRDFSVDRYKPLATCQVKFVSAGATTLVGTKSANITNFESGDSTTVPIGVTLNHYSQPFHVGQDELMSGLRLENLTSINLATLANTITLAALKPIVAGALDASGSPVAYSAGTYHASASAGTFGWSTDMPRLRGYLAKSPIKNAVLDGAFYSFLTNQPGFYQPTQTGPRGDRVTTFGWDNIHENSVWPTMSGKTLGGLVCNPQAVAVAAGLPQNVPTIPGNTLQESVITIPGPDISIACYLWFSLASRTLWCSYDVMFGAAGADASAGAVLFNGAGPRS